MLMSIIMQIINGVNLEYGGEGLAGFAIALLIGMWCIGLSIKK